MGVWVGFFVAWFKGMDYANLLEKDICTTFLLIIYNVGLDLYNQVFLILFIVEPFWTLLASIIVMFQMTWTTIK